MSGMITNVISKSLVGVSRLGAYGFGVAAAAKLGCLGYRVVHHMAAPYTQKDGILEKPAQWAAAARIKPYADEDMKAEKMELVKQALALAMVAWVIHDATYYFEGAPPKIYNTVLSITPIRVINTSIIDAIKETIKTFDAKALFVNS
ncbi:MAG: hypothetical protein H7A41_03230 [Chlamydiales bacterium]|nr:hypothetical protein [Chlamydiales bacterium]